MQLKKITVVNPFYKTPILVYLFHFVVDADCCYSFINIKGNIPLTLRMICREVQPAVHSDGGWQTVPRHVVLVSISVAIKT